MAKCHRCNKNFEPKRFWQRYCSSTCKRAFEADERKAAIAALKEKRSGIQESSHSHNSGHEEENSSNESD